MHFHLPKPLHGWRAFAGEVGIIVLGVLIALSLDQLVDAWHWRNKVSASENAMRDELLWDDGPQIYQRAAMHPCVVARLDAIRASVEQSKRRSDIGQLIDGYWVQTLTYDSIAHDTATSSDVLDHIPADELEPFTLAYQRMPLMDRTNAQEGTDIARLQAFRRIGGAVSGAEKDRLLEAIGALRNEDAIMWQSAVLKLPEIWKIGVLDRQRIAMFMRNARGHYGSCVHDLPPNFPDDVLPGTRADISWPAIASFG